ncbi:hypothetical protein D9758_008334 [Tetrapyrgos nigripes]|uniref:Zn(2)-C6 fungal-type domain-containing protein n=1 Tax=Tetrapyrgos nigripes TaxID=182062 RepID=A0A8H5GDS4_9AGAR|nr:hypothetical protein D9758_008334 [Tetrapyrgos nigripes]
MSSNEEDFDNDGLQFKDQNSKRRRIQRACDICRRKKIRCDGVQMPGNRCSNCIAYSLECTYVEAAKKRGPPKAYVESLETRLEKMEKLLHRLVPDIDLTDELGLGFTRDSWQSGSTSNPSRPRQAFEDGCPQPADIAATILRKLDHSNIPLEASDEDYINLKLVDDLSQMELNPPDHRFFGKSSGAMLIQTAIDLKQEYTGQEVDIQTVILGERRPHYWTPFAWETAFTEMEHPRYVFPDDDLLHHLIDEYFINVNIFLPLLHRPTFERSVAEKLHYQNDMFATVVLLVCAVGSRYTHDRRVLLDGEDSWHSCGWKYFDQVLLVRKSLLAPPTLYDLQFYCVSAQASTIYLFLTFYFNMLHLHPEFPFSPATAQLSVQFLEGSSAPHSCWTMVGIGIRLAQDVGAHRRKMAKPMTVEDELWKRAFWVLVCMDRTISTSLGRPCAIQDEDYDLDLPLEVDDEYWEHSDPAQAFRQPPGKPSTVSAFILTLKLNKILAFALRTISKILLGFAGPEWEQQLVTELDSAMNQWIDSVPDHCEPCFLFHRLKWDPNREDDVFFNQSVNIYVQYYHLQILIHRPFIPSPRKPSPLAFPSLAICTNAARSCSHVIDIQRKRNAADSAKLSAFRHYVPDFPIQMSAFTAGIVLLLNIWGGKRSGMSVDPNKEMADVHKCMQVLRKCEDRWHSSGRLWDILYELACVGDLPLPNFSPPMQNKREWGSDSPSSQSSDTLVAEAPSTGRAIAGSRRVASSSSAAPSSQAPPSQSKRQDSSSNKQCFSLPMYTNELGRLPLHGQVNFSTSSQPTHQPQSMAGNEYWYPPDVMQSHSGDITLSPARYSTQAGQPAQSAFYDGLGGYSGSYMGGADAGGGQGAGLGYPYGMNGDGMTRASQQAGPTSVAADHGLIDPDTIAMWSSAPTGFELDDWGTYLANVSEITQSINQGGVPTNPIYPKTKLHDDGPYIYGYAYSLSFKFYFSKPCLISIFYFHFFGATKSSPDLVDLLDQNDIKGTFFYNGDNSMDIKSARIHGIMMTLLLSLGTKSTMKMWRVEQALQRILGVNPAFMRPSYNDLVLQASAVRGQKVVIWDFDDGDSTGSPPDESKADYDQLVSKHPNTVIALNHETYDYTKTEGGYPKSEWISRQPEDGKYALKDGGKLCLYVSTVPCGDASTRYLAAFQDPEMAALKTLNTLQPASTSTSSSSISTHARGRNNYSLYSVLRTKPGRADSPPTLCMSCSDKLAMWNVLGIQGALGAEVMKPLYFDEVVVGEVAGDEMRKMVKEDCERAFWGRLDVDRDGARVDLRRRLKVSVDITTYTNPPYTSPIYPSYILAPSCPKLT